MFKFKFKPWFYSDDNDEKSPTIELQVTKAKREVIYFKAKKVVLAAGGQQSLPEDIKLLGIKPKTDKFFFSSDDVLKKEGFIRLLEYIQQNDVKEISIIGGSHSGLSCAWMLLNGSAMFDFKEYEPHDFDIDVLNEEKREIIFNMQKRKGLKECRKHKNFIRKSSFEGPSFEQYSELGEEFEYSPWQIGGILSHPEFSHIKIKIIYKNEIKVHYKSKEEAQMDGYTNFTKN